jgi:hypothetical protein
MFCIKNKQVEMFLYHEQAGWNIFVSRSWKRYLSQSNIYMYYRRYTYLQIYENIKVGIEMWTVVKIRFYYT